MEDIARAAGHIHQLFVEHLQVNNSQNVIESSVTRKFAIFLEDFMINDPRFAIIAGRINHAELVCNILLQHSTHFQRFKIGEFPVEEYLKMFQDSAESKMQGSLLLFINCLFVFDGKLFYQFIDGVWKSYSHTFPLIEIDCLRDRLVKQLDITIHELETFLQDCTHKNCALLALRFASLWLQEKINIFTGLRLFKDHNIIEKHIRSKPVNFNQHPHLIATRNKVINLQTGSISDCSYKYHLTKSISYDLPDDTSNLMKLWLNEFSDRTKLLKFLRLCGMRSDKTLIILRVPPCIYFSNGMTGEESYGSVAATDRSKCDIDMLSFASLIGAIYQQYIRITPTPSAEINSDIVRTEFYYDVPLWSEAQLQAYPISNLVFMTRSDIVLPDRYAGRQVHKLDLEQFDWNQNIFNKIFTTVQLGKALRYIITEGENGASSTST